MLFKSLKSITQTQSKVQSASIVGTSMSNQSSNGVCLLDNVLNNNNTNVGIANNNSGNNVLGVLSQQSQ